MTSEPTNLAKKTPLPQSQISDTNLNGAADGTGYPSSYQEKVADHPTYNASAGLPNNMITATTLNSNSTSGMVAKPSFDGGESLNATDAGADVMNREAMGEANVTASTENLSAKYKYPRVSDDPGAARLQWNTPQ